MSKHYNKMSPSPPNLHSTKVISYYKPDKRLDNAMLLPKIGIKCHHMKIVAKKTQNFPENCSAFLQGVKMPNFSLKKFREQEVRPHFSF